MYRRLFRNRNFLALWIGQMISFIGDYFVMLAVPIAINRLTGSAMMVGLSFIAAAIPALLLGPVAGVFIDRWDRRKVMIISDGMRALLVLLMLLVRSADQVWIFYLANFLVACTSQFFMPARNAVLPLVVADRDDLLAANGLMQLVGTTQVIVDRVVDHADHALMRVRDCRAHLGGQVGRVGQIALVEQPGRCSGAAVRQQRRMRSEARPLLRGGSQREPPAKQAGAADLSDGRQRRHADQRLPEGARHHLGPAMARAAREQLSEDADAQPIHHQQEGRMGGSDWRHDMLEYGLDRHQAPIDGRLVRVPLDQRLGEWLGELVPPRDQRFAARAVGLRQLRNLVAAEQTETCPVHEGAFVRLPGHGTRQRRH